ncbi:osteoclast-associated immunoglobulin-like receptor [Chrysemys picta bellii]|uniref:osteoclast-associated immunoglobulin-like receptor n=1 Tax=Chrysemys picta bellii TaxID=8478 RepID=UPI0032B19410
MASALVVLILSCWLAGQSEVSGWGTDLPHMTTTPAPTFLSSIQPVTSAGGRHSTSTLPERELSYPKPSISLSPSGGVPLGGAVTVWCRGWGWNMRFLLYKEGNLTTLQDAEPAGDLAEFLIRNVSRRDAGNYSCYYHHYWFSFIWSHPSDPVELVVAELSYPKPSILLSPSGVVPLGGAVTVQCWGWHWHWHWYQNMRFLLYKDGNPNMLQDVEPRWDLADFLIRNVSWRDAGSYGCYYYSHWNPLIWSHPSDPVELVVAGGSEPSAAPDLTHNIIAGVSAAAVGLLLLLLAFVCYRRTRGNASIDEGKELQTLEPDPGIYAELDRQTLQPSVYDMIDMSRGGPQ